MTTPTPEDELREAHAQWLEQIAAHVSEAGEVVPYDVNEILEVLSQRGVPTPHQFFPQLSNTDFTATTYLRTAARWIRDHKPIVVPSRESMRILNDVVASAETEVRIKERNEMQARAETAAHPKTKPEKLSEIVGRAIRQQGHGLTPDEVLTLADDVNARLPL